MSHQAVTQGEPPYEPTWDVAALFPEQGHWSEEEYLTLPGGRLVELADGVLEVLPVPTEEHQLAVAFLYRVLLAFLEQHRPGSVVLFAPLPVRIRDGRYREPDVAVALAEHAERRHGRYWDGADLVMEVVSPESRAHDTVTKRRDYALAAIPEYWIVDPEERRITVLSLSGGDYATHGEFGEGEVATSALLPGLQVPVDDLLRAASASHGPSQHP